MTSLAALTLPLNVNEGAPFPGRDLVLFVTFAVILATLVLQGLSVPPIIRASSPEAVASTEKEEARGRLAAAEAALLRMDELAEEE